MSTGETDAENAGASGRDSTLENASTSRPAPPAAAAPQHPLASWITPKARKGVDSSIEGRGIVAIESIGAGETVAVKGGHILTTTELHALPDPLGNSDIQIDNELHLAAVTMDEYEPVMLFLNHSCEPNVGIAGNVVFVAMRDIAAGEELVTDYALFDDYDGEMPCNCGTDACRRVIGGRDWKRPELQQRYRGYFSRYLQRKIDAGSGEPKAS